MAKRDKKASAPTDSQRPYDVVVWGATGFTGRLVAEYLAERYGDGELRWAMAGRNQGKLEALRDELAAARPSAAEVDVLLGDSHDRASLDALAAQARVVCTTVGPYARYGSELVAACVAQGAHYCDLTGEVHWIRRMIDAHHERARDSGVRIVHCCGFDSIPSDLGTLLLQQTAVERTGSACDRVALYVEALRGAPSGGTIASITDSLELMKDPDVRRVLGNPYALDPAGEPAGPDGSDRMGLHYDRDARAWTGPFIMAAVNTRVVRRSHALLGYPWGRDFRYSERSEVGRGVSGFLRGLTTTAGLGTFALTMSLRPTRWLLKKTVLPEPGEGPSREKIDGGRFRIRLDGYQGDGGSPALSVRVRGARDPGYGATAVMLGESALCLAEQGATLDTPGGVLTPASAMGQTLIDRFADNDVISFEIV